MSASTQPPLEIHSGIVLKGQLSMVKDVVLTGKFEGDLQTLGCLTVASGGAATGTINAGALVLEPGNLVEARIQVAPPPKSAFPVEGRGETKGGFFAAGVEKLKKVFSFGRK